MASKGVKTGAQFGDPGSAADRQLQSRDLTCTLVCRALVYAGHWSACAPMVIAEARLSYLLMFWHCAEGRT